MSDHIIQLFVNLQATVKQDGDLYIACCPLLDVCSQGDDEERALENLIEAIELFLATDDLPGAPDQGA